MEKLMMKSMSRSNTKDNMYKDTLIREYREAITLAKLKYACKVVDVQSMMKKYVHCQLN